MKKITLLIVLIAFFANSLKIQSQIIDEPANWPNPNWDIAGVFSASGFAQDPRTSSNFSWDDDAAGSGSITDDIAAQSPTINLTTAIPTEQQLQVTVDYVYRRVGDVLTLEWFDLSLGVWIVWEQFNNNSNNLDFKSCTGMQTFVSQPLTIASFTTTQLLGFRYRIRYNDNGFDWGMCFESPTLISIETPACLEVSSITIDPLDITASQAIISWADSNGVPPNNGWEIEYGTTGFPQGTGTVVPALVNPFTLTGLSANTTYDVYIRALCSNVEQSGWIGPISFSTQGAGTGCGGQFVDSGGAAGQYNDGEDITTTLCPDVSGDVVTVNFLSFDTESCCDNLTIYNGDTATGTPLGVFAGTDLPPTFTSTDATGCLTFVFHSDGSIVRDGWVANIICSPPPTCFAVTNITVTNITQDSATINWIDNNTPAPLNGWEVEIVPSGSTPTGVGLPATSIPFMATGLNPSTLYDVYVRAICDDAGNDDPSFWIATTFATLIAPPECGGIFVDSGGPAGQYGNNELETTIICPDVSGEVVTVQFITFDLEANFDDLTIYNGNTATGTPLGVFDGTNLPPTFTSTDATGCLTFVFDSDVSVTRDGWIANVICGLPPTCFIPTNLNATTITSVSAVLSWTENTTPTAATSWNIEIVLAGATPTGVGIPVTSNPYTALGLDPDTAYDFYVQADCGGGDTSVWSTPFSFQTEITPPVCGGIFVDDGGANGDYSNGQDSTTIICPIDAGDVVSVEFISFDTEAGFDNMTIYNGDSTAAPLLGVFEGTALPPTFISSHPSGCLTFVFQSDGVVTRPGWEANVICAPPPTCFVVSNITVTAIGITSAQINWTDNNPVPPIGGWDVEYGFSGFVQGTGAVDTNTTNPHTLNGLASSTDYDVYVRANCAGDDSDSSLWTGPVSFRTDDAPPPNDTCITAIPLLVTTECELTIGNNVLATESSALEGEVLPSTCAPFINNGEVLDVWYVIDVPATRNVYIQTTRVIGGMVDTVLAVYSGECGNLVELDCQDDSVITGEDAPEDAPFSSIFLRDIDASIDTLYIRVWSITEFVSDGDIIPNVQGAFNICVLGQSRGHQSPLANNENVIDAINLSYYPNPVNDILNVTADKEIAQIVLYNILGQEVLNKSFNNQLNTTLDIQNLQPGTYVAKVVVEDLIKTFKFIKK